MIWDFIEIISHHSKWQKAVLFLADSLSLLQRQKKCPNKSTFTYSHMHTLHVLLMESRNTLYTIQIFLFKANYKYTHMYIETFPRCMFTQHDFLKVLKNFPPNLSLKMEFPEISYLKIVGNFHCVVCFLLKEGSKRLFVSIILFHTTKVPWILTASSCS